MQWTISMKFNVIQRIDKSEHILYDGNDELYAKQLTVHLIEEYAEELMFNQIDLEEKRAIEIARERFRVMTVKNKTE